MEPLFVISSVGHDVCCNQYQAGQIHVGIDCLRLIKQRGKNDEVTAECQRAEESLAALINTFRLDCDNCLNAECPHRDPNCPVEEVQRRAKLFDVMGLPIKQVEEA